MRAYLRTCRGKLLTENLKLRSGIPVPQLTKPDEVLIRVSHVALNGAVIFLVKLFPHSDNSPWIPELEFSGTVVAIGSETQGLKVGDQVCGTRDHGSWFRYNGCLSEYVLAPERLVVKKPVNADMVEAAGLLGVGCTALQCCRFADVKKGDKLLVTGGSGGLGSMVVQVAKAIVGPSGLIVATCSARNVEMVKRIGADEVIDYTKHAPLHEFLSENHSNEPFNTILDCAGADQDLYSKSPAYLQSSGMFIVLGALPVTIDPSLWTFISWALWTQVTRFRPTLLGGVPRRLRMFAAMPDQETSERVVDWYERGQIKAVTAGVWYMEDAIAAYELQQSSRARGKIVIDVQT